MLDSVRCLAVTWCSASSRATPKRREERPTRPLIRSSPPGSGAIDLRIVVKEPGPDFQFASGTSALPLAEVSEADPLPPYVKLSNIAPILENSPSLLAYARGSWGPDAAAQLAAPDGWLLG